MAIESGHSPLGPPGTPAAAASAAQGWAATIAALLAPGITDANTLADWLRLLTAATDFPVEGDLEPVKQWFRDSFATVAGRSIAGKDVVDRLLAGMAASPSPAEFARNWLRRKALHPLAEYGNENLLQLPGLNIGSPVERDSGPPHTAGISPAGTAPRRGVRLHVPRR